MNPWFERFLAGAGVDLDELSREEAALVLDLAGTASRSAGARPFAPLATYLAGRAVAAGPPAARAQLLARLLSSAGGAGTAEEELGA